MDSVSNATPFRDATALTGATGEQPPRGDFAAASDAAVLQAKGSAPADTPPDVPSATDKRPSGDTRSAQEIIDGDPTLKNLGNQSGVKDNLKKQVGDFEHDPDAAYRASEVLKHIKSAKTSDGQDRSGGVTNNGKIEGFTKDGDARHGTEAGLLQDFGKHGYSALKDGQTLDKTNDRHVKQDGTNMDNAAFVGHEIVHGLSEAAGWIGKELDKLPGPLKSLLGPLHMMSKAASGGLNVADAAITGGDVKQAGKDMAHGLLSTGSGIIQGAADLVDATVGKVPGLGKLANAAVQPLATAASGGLHVADTAVQGGDVKQAAEQMGADVAGSAVESVVGLADPTGVASGAAGSAVSNAISKGSGSAGGSEGAPAGGAGDMLSDALGALPGKKGGKAGKGAEPGASDQHQKPGGAGPVAPGGHRPGVDGGTTRSSPTQDFNANPIGYIADHHVTHGHGTGPQLPASNTTHTVDGNNNRINYHVAETPHGSEVRPGPAPGNAPGATGSAYWLPYANGGASNSIHVPSRPGPNDPHMVLTPGLSGCTFHARPDRLPNGQVDPNGRTTFTHTSGVPSTPAQPGQDATVPNGAIGTDYHSYSQRPGGVGQGSVPTAFAFGHYDPQNQNWNISVQKHDTPIVPSSKPSVAGGETYSIT